MDAMIGRVPDDWQQRRLDKVCDILAAPSAKLLGARERSAGDVPVVTSSDLRHNRIQDECASGVTAQQATELRRYALRTNDIVCARVLGPQGIVADHQQDWLLGASCHRLRVRPDVDARYLLYYLSHPAAHAWLTRSVRGATVPTMSAPMLGALPVAIPPREVQVNTATVLHVLDDKIVAHERVIDTAETLRTALLVQILADRR